MVRELRAEDGDRRTKAVGENEHGGRENASNGSEILRIMVRFDGAVGELATSVG